MEGALFGEPKNFGKCVYKTVGGGGGVSVNLSSPSVSVNLRSRVCVSKTLSPPFIEKHGVGLIPGCGSGHCPLQPNSYNTYQFSMK